MDFKPVQSVARFRKVFRVDISVVSLETTLIAELNVNVMVCLQHGKT